MELMEFNMIKIEDPLHRFSKTVTLEVSGSFYTFVVEGGTRLSLRVPCLSQSRFRVETQMFSVGRRLTTWRYFKEGTAQRFVTQYRIDSDSASEWLNVWVFRLALVWSVGSDSFDCNGGQEPGISHPCQPKGLGMENVVKPASQILFRFCRFGWSKNRNVPLIYCLQMLHVAGARSHRGNLSHCGDPRHLLTVWRWFVPSLAWEFIETSSKMPKS